MSGDVLGSLPSSTEHLVLMEDTKNWCFVARVPKYPVPGLALIWLQLQTSLGSHLIPGRSVPAMLKGGIRDLTKWTLLVYHCLAAEQAELFIRKAVPSERLAYAKQE